MFPCAFLLLQIHFLLLQNRQGKTRLAKYYSAFEHEEKRQLEVRNKEGGEAHNKSITGMSCHVMCSDVQ